MYGSYRKPRELLWIIGVVIYLGDDATAFFAICCPGVRCLTGAPR